MLVSFHLIAFLVNEYFTPKWQRNVRNITCEVVVAMSTLKTKNCTQAFGNFMLVQLCLFLLMILKTSCRFIRFFAPTIFIGRPKAPPLIPLLSLGYLRVSGFFCLCSTGPLLLRPMFVIQVALIMFY